MVNALLHQKMRRIWNALFPVLFAAALFLIGSAPAPPPSDHRFSTSIISPGEELTYEVRWFKVHLGRIRLRTFTTTHDSSETIYHAAASVDSYEGLPFVDVHARDRTDMDTLFYSRGFRAFEKKNNVWHAEISRYNLPAKTVIIERSTHPTISSPADGPLTYDTVRIPDTRIQDGLSILYFARANVHSATQMRVPTVVYGKLGTTHFSFESEPTTAEIDALEDKKIRVKYFEGKAEFEGLYGLTGDFKGWFSDDEAAVPIRAEMKVLLGSVTIELTAWSRKGWQPPTVQ